MKKKYVRIGMIVLTALLICGAAYGVWNQNRTITLEFGMFVGSNWDVANANSYVIIDKAIEQFEAEHPRVKIHYSSGITKEDYSEWLSQQILLGKTPDVFMIETSDFNQFSSIGVMKNLDTLMFKDADFQKEDYYTTAFNTGKYMGNQYALPYETVPTLMFVNKTLLNKNGFAVPADDWTWDDFYHICQAITQDKDGDGTLDQFGAYNYNWRNAVIANGAELFDANGTEAYFNEKAVVSAVRFAKQIYDTNQGHKVTQDDFDGGHVAFMPLLFSDYRTYKTYPYKIKKYTTFKWDCITLPAGPEGANTSEVNTLLMGIGNKTRHEELAWEFLKLLTYDEEIQMDIFQYSQGASVLTNVTRSEEAEAIIKEDMDEGERVIDNQLLSRVIENGTISPKFQKYDDVIALAESEVNQIIEDDKNIESSLKIFQRTIGKYLRK